MCKIMQIILYASGEYCYLSSYHLSGTLWRLRIRKVCYKKTERSEWYEIWDSKETDTFYTWRVHSIIHSLTETLSAIGSVTSQSLTIELLTHPDEQKSHFFFFFSNYWNRGNKLLKEALVSVSRITFHNWTNRSKFGKIEGANKSISFKNPEALEKQNNTEELVLF